MNMRDYWPFFIVVGLSMVIVTFAIIYMKKRDAEFMTQCVKDHKAYECEYMLNHNLPIFIFVGR